jgi:hypothetical protein
MTSTLAAPIIMWAAPAPITYGTALSGTQLNATASLNGVIVAGNFLYTPAAGAVLAAGSRTLSVTFTPTDTTTFASASATVTLLVNKATLTVTASNAAMIYGAAPPAITPSYIGFVNGNTAATAVTTPPTCSTTATSASPTSPPTYPSICTGGAAANYSFSFVPGVVKVNPASTVTTITSNLPNPSIVGQIVTVNFSVAPQYSGIPTGIVTVNAVTVAGTGQSCTGTLSAGAGSCTMSFTPGGTRTLTATYNPGTTTTNFLTSTSAAVTQNVSSVSLSTNSLLFGNQTVGTNSARQTITLSNVGVTPLPISTIAISPSTDYSFTTTCPVGGSLAVGRSCSINLTFSPTAPGVRAATLTITDSNPNPLSTQTVSLTGTGIAPVNSVTPTSLTFAPQARNSTSPTQTVTVTNTGNAPLTLAGISLTGASRRQFTQTNTCPPRGSIAVGGSCTVSVSFTPTSTGAQSATLQVSATAPAVTQNVTLTGTGL